MISLVFIYLEARRYDGVKVAAEMKKKCKSPIFLTIIVLDDFKLVESEFDYAVTMLDD